MVQGAAEHRRGTPPRAWGSGAAEGDSGEAERDTPTCVGISIHSWRQLSSFAGHPHVRGDQRRSRSSMARSLGTPPRAWGSGQLRQQGDHGLRDTPTCVGISHAEAGQASRRAGHPHVRGDQPTVNATAAFKRGTPPRAWGSVAGVGTGSMPRRDTPTCVGIRARAHPLLPPLPGHPHVRGDQVLDNLLSHNPCGTPPRAWGSGSLSLSVIRHHRDTPTCVGIRRPTFWSPTRRPGHPHVRGDQDTWRQGLSSGSGTPPRAWGSGPRWRSPAGSFRDTPTCVGISSSSSDSIVPLPGHPHVRGDQVVIVCSS